MIELDPEDRQLIENGEDPYQRRLIRRFLLSHEHKQWLTDNDLEISDLLQGRVTGDQEPMVETIFTDWNEKLGNKVFGYG